jgi:hypothetical protein
MNDNGFSNGFTSEQLKQVLEFASPYDISECGSYGKKVEVINEE